MRATNQLSELFSGFSEGNSNLVVDLYATTLVFHNYADAPEQTLSLIKEALKFYQYCLPWLKVGIIKTRNAKSIEETREKYYLAIKQIEKSMNMVSGMPLT